MYTDENGYLQQQNIDAFIADMYNDENNFDVELDLNGHKVKIKMKKRMPAFLIEELNKKKGIDRTYFLAAALTVKPQITAEQYKKFGHDFLMQIQHVLEPFFKLKDEDLKKKKLDLKSN